MYTQSRFASVAVLFSFTAALASAQSVISVHSGTLHYSDGAVMIDGTPVETKVGKFQEIKEKSVLSTGRGRAEILLTPGVFLRVGENTEIRMLDNRLASTRVEVLKGSAIVESDDPELSVKNPAVTILYKDYQIQPVKFGIFEITSEPAELRVYKGQATVQTGTEHVAVKEGRLLPFSAALLSEKFDEKQADDLYLWTRDRSAYISAANMSSARTLASSQGLGYGGSGFSSNGYDPSLMGPGLHGVRGANWYYNSFLNMYTFMPYAGTLWSPFGYGFYSPYSIYSYYSPGSYYWYGGGGSRASSSTGIPLNNISTSSLAAAQISRRGAGVNTHPTLSSPIRSVNGASMTNSANSGFRNGGIDTFGGGMRPANPGFNSVVGGNSGGNSGGSGGFSPAVSARGGGGGAAAAAPAGGNVGGGGRGK